MTDAVERWLPVVGYEGLYEVSDHGRVRSLDRVVYRHDGLPSRRRGTMRKQERIRGKSTEVRLAVGLNKNGRRRMRYVHHLVLEAFVGLRPEGTEACHEDDDSANNHLSNLRWDTHLANMADRARNGIWPFHGRTHCKNGHEFTVENTGWHRPTARKCLTCERAAKRRYADKIKSARAAAAAEVAS